MRTGAVGKLQELRRKIYLTAKSEKPKAFGGLYCHVSKEEVLMEAYREAKANKGAAGIDGITFEDVERYGVENFIAELSKELEKVPRTQWFWLERVE